MMEVALVVISVIMVYAGRFFYYYLNYHYVKLLKLQYFNIFEGYESSYGTAQSAFKIMKEILQS